MEIFFIHYVILHPDTLRVTKTAFDGGGCFGFHSALKDKGGYQHSGGYSCNLSFNGLKQREIELEEGSAVLSQHVSHGMRRSF